MSVARHVQDCWQIGLVAFQRGTGRLMSMGVPLSVPPGFDDLPVDEQIDYVQALWDRILVRDGQGVESPEWHREEVRRALEQHEANPETARPWPEVRAELEAKFRKR